jgi:hypothetical protein
MREAWSQLAGLPTGCMGQEPTSCRMTVMLPSPNAAPNTTSTTARSLLLTDWIDEAGCYMTRVENSSATWAIGVPSSSWSVMAFFIQTIRFDGEGEHTHFLSMVMLPELLDKDPDFSATYLLGECR